MRRTTHLAVCLTVAALGFAIPGLAPAQESSLTLVAMPPGPGPYRVEFTVSNPDEQGTKRTIVGYRYNPACKASTVVLLQHGLSYHKEAWDFPGYSVAQSLASAGYAVVAIDRLGYGESKLDDGNNVSFEAYADMTDQIVRQLRLRFTHVVLGGHSAGGGLAEYTQGMYGSADAIMPLG